MDRNGTIDLDAGKGGQALVVSLSPEGKFRWMRASGGSASTMGMAIVTGPSDEIYIAGSYHNGAPDFDGDGSPIWIQGATGSGLQMAGSLAIATAGDLLVLGGYGAPPHFDEDGKSDLKFRSRGDRVWKHDIDANIFLIRVNADGKRIWARRYTSPARHVTARGDRIALSGAYSSVLDVDDDGTPERGSDGDEEREGFTAILDGDGKLLQVLTVVGEHHDIVNAAGFSPDGKTLYLTGYTSLGADFDGDGKVEAASVCHKAGEVYLAMYRLEE